MGRPFFCGLGGAIPHSPSGRKTFKGDLYASSSRIFQAEEMYQTALKIAPLNTEARTKLEILRGKKVGEEASINSYNKVIQFQGESKQFH